MTYSPVVSLTTIRILIAVATKEKLHVTLTSVLMVLMKYIYLRYNSYQIYNSFNYLYFILN